MRDDMRFAQASFALRPRAAADAASAGKPERRAAPCLPARVLKQASEPKLGLLRIDFCGCADPTGRGVAEATGALRGQRGARHVRTAREGVVTGYTYLLFPASVRVFRLLAASRFLSGKKSDVNDH